MPSSNADTRSYFHLSIEDLLQAQQIFHSDLIDRAHVVATAVGRYRQRIDDDATDAKTLANTEVRPNSWPCLLVFVDTWADPKDFYSDKMYYHRIPPYLSLPDRRRVPTCVIKVEQDTSLDPPLFQKLNFPTWMIGGGFPVVRRAQEEDRAGSLGCLVTDGANTYALTNRHVSGAPGSVIETFVNGHRQRIGVTADRQLAKVDVDKAFPGFQVARGWAEAVTYTNVDAGLIDVDDVNQWTAQIYGLGEVGDLFDLSADTLTLDLIGRKVRAFGAASGELHGEIQGFFYRYKTVGSFGYVSDILIGPPPNGDLVTIPGDSGTLWCIEDEKNAKKIQPFAMQWGGHRFSAGGRYRIALATSLSTILRSLDVDLITEWNTGHTEYWGKIGHYKVAATACTVIDGAAKAMIQKNQDNITFTDPDISQKNVNPGPKEFVPLADVADLVWRTTRKKDSANHFADMDQKGNSGPFAGKTLLDLTKGGKNVDADFWVQYYQDVATDRGHMGALPFRVWQMFDEAVTALKAGQADRWVAAMGLMAHYVGDACQPLHVSFLHHGRPDHPGEDKVHSVYESNMLDRNALDLVQKVKAVLPDVEKPDNVASGFEAAKAVVELMRRTIADLPPLEVIDAHNETDGAGRIKNMWQVLGDRTAKAIADGSKTLAMIWDSAWEAGGGKPSQVKTIDQDDLMTLYNDPTFVRSERLDDMAKLGLLNVAGAKPQTLSAKPAKAKPKAKNRRRPRPTV